MLAPLHPVLAGASGSTGHAHTSISHQLRRNAAAAVVQGGWGPRDQHPDGRGLRHVVRGLPQPSHLALAWRAQQELGPCANRRARTSSISCRADASVSSSAASTNIAVSQYLGRGPYDVSQPITLKFMVGQGRSGALECSLNMFLPKAGPQATPQRWPVMVLSAGFLLHSGLYQSYASDLASWGIAVVLYDLPELVDDVTMVSALGLILDACTRDPRVSQHVDSRAVLLAGHSRGGKLSALTAASDPRVKGIALLDPVDVTAMTPPGPGYPSALPAMRVACGPPRNTPCLIVGAACNGGVIPADANYSADAVRLHTRLAARDLRPSRPQALPDELPGPCWYLELTGAGHLQFLDARVDLFSALVKVGPTPDAAVREVSQAALVAWALELAVPLARGEAVVGRQVLERLQGVSAILERRAPVSWSFKGFDSLGASAGSTGGRSTAAAAGAPGAGSNGSRSSGSSGSRSASGAYGAGAAAAASGVMNDAGHQPSSRAGSEQAAAASSSASRKDGGTSRNSRSSKWSYEELMRMRARELKTILVDRGVDCSDCFEKADLARRIMERC